MKSLSLTTTHIERIADTVWTIQLAIDAFEEDETPAVCSAMKKLYYDLLDIRDEVHDYHVATVPFLIKQNMEG